MQFAIEPAEFDRMVAGEIAMQVQEVIPAFMVMPLTIIIITFIPDIFESLHRFRLAVVDFLTRSASIFLQ